MFKKIYIEITNVCNLNCEFCPKSKRKLEFMNIKDFENIIIKIKNYTNLVALHVKGEPLLHNDLKTILEILEKYNLKANITTNGLLLQKNVDYLCNSKSLRQLNISLHSMNENNIFHGKTLYEIFRASDLLKNTIVSYRLWNVSKDNLNVNDNIINEIEKYYGIANISELLHKDGYFKIKNNIFINEDYEFTWPSINGPIINSKGRCLALKDQIAILVDGTVVPCCMDNDGDIYLGNILNESLEEILNKEKTKKIKTNFMENKIVCDLCKTCGFLKNLTCKRKNK